MYFAIFSVDNVRIAISFSPDPKGVHYFWLAFYTTKKIFTPFIKFDYDSSDQFAFSRAFMGSAQSLMCHITSNCNWIQSYYYQFFCLPLSHVLFDKDHMSILNS